MKSCSQCNRRYENNALHYCTLDGNPLLVPPEVKDARTLKIPSLLNFTPKKILAASLLVGFVILAAISFGSPSKVFHSKLVSASSAPDKRLLDNTGEPSTLIDKAVLSLDLTRRWVELDEKQRKEAAASKGILRGDFVLRKLNNNAKFGRRIGTTSRFKPEWRSFTHRVDAQEDGRKCSPEVQHSYMLYFNIENEGIDIPFNLSYEIDYWNAHNGAKGDWQSVYVGHPTKHLTIRVLFPKDKPYTNFSLKSGDGVDCNAKPEPHENPEFVEGVDEATGAKTITWAIDSPKLHWVYRVEWKW